MQLESYCELWGLERLSEGEMGERRYLKNSVILQDLSTLRFNRLLLHILLQRALNASNHRL